MSEPKVRFYRSRSVFEEKMPIASITNDYNGRGEVNLEKSVTVPDMTMTLRELVNRFRRGQDLDLLEPKKVGIPLEIDEVMKMDKVERIERSKQVKRAMRKVKKMVEEKKKIQEVEENHQKKGVVKKGKASSNIGNGEAMSDDE